MSKPTTFIINTRHTHTYTHFCSSSSLLQISIYTLVKKMEINMTQLCDLDPMLDDAKILARVISIWKSHPKQRPNEVWSLDAVLQDQMSCFVHVQTDDDRQVGEELKDASTNEIPLQTTLMTGLMYMILWTISLMIALWKMKRHKKILILNRALLLKWVWRFISGDDSLWCKVIQAIYGSKFDLHVTDQPSIWCSILREVKSLKDSGFDFSSLCKKRIGDGSCTSFWYDIWLADAPLCVQFPRLFALELDKEIVVANKMGASSVSASFRRDVRDGAERQQP
ncbi:hypothetical protein Tco_0526658 [Tanacetum coccineum]